MSKLVNILCAMLLFGPLAAGYWLDDGSIAHANKVNYIPGGSIQVGNIHINN